jgi:nicotinamide riboside transporter PnuC
LFIDFYKDSIAKHEDWSKFLLTSGVTALTFSGLFNTPAMYADSWIFWQFFNVLKLIQNWHFGNIAYVAKYIFYLFNAGLAWFVWRGLVRKKEEPPKLAPL